MQHLVTYISKAIRYIYSDFRKIMDKVCASVLFYCNNIQFKSLHSNGIPYVNVARGGSCQVGANFRMNNGLKGNPIGRPQRCVLFVGGGAILTIGENVGISSTAIGKNVKIGGEVCIYDTDFHSLDPELRIDSKLDRNQKSDKPVYIGDNVFIGAHSTILKGVRVGKNAIIGASSSLVAKDILSNEIWAGNPTKFIKKLN